MEQQATPVQQHLLKIGVAVVVVHQEMVLLRLRLELVA
jgi:hypothetical protein